MGYKMNGKKIFISACECSADRHAATIAKEIKRRYPDCELVGVGSDYSREAGIDVKLDISKYSTVGIIEPLRYAPQLIRSYFKMKALLKAERPDIFIPIDNQGLHMKLCKVAKSLDIPVHYFIAPQEWHWGTEKGGKKVLESVDRILAIFPQEKEFYERCGGDAIYVGHPTVERVMSFREKRKAESIIAIFPGSRPQEIQRCLPTFLDAVIPFAKRKACKVVVSVANESYRGLIEQLCKHVTVELSTDEALRVMETAKIAVLTSGTVSLEAALMKLPHVVCYRFNSLTYWIAHTFFKKVLDRIPFMSMPNILLNNAIFPELLQKEFYKRFYECSVRTVMG